MGKKPRKSRYSAGVAAPALRGVLSGDSGCGSTSSTPPSSPGTSPSKTYYNNYTPHQEAVLWEAFNESVYPSLARRAELGKQLKLPAKVIMCFFRAKREGLFKRLCKAGQEDTVLKIKQAHKNIAKDSRLVKKQLKLRLDDAAQNAGEKLKRKKRVSKESPGGKITAKSKDPLTKKSKTQKQQKQPRKKRKCKVKGQDGSVDVKIEIPSEQQSCSPNQHTQNQQQEVHPQQPETSQEYQYGPADYCDNRPSILHSPQPFHQSANYYGPYYTSTGSSYGLMHCPPNPWICSVNAVWAPTPPVPYMNDNTWTSRSSAIDLSMTQNRDGVNDFQFTQNLGNADSSYPPTTHTKGSGSTLYGFNYSDHQVFGSDQLEDQSYYGTSGNSAPNYGQFLPAATDHNTLYQSIPARTPDFASDQDFHTDSGRYPTPDSSPAHDLYPTTIQTLRPPPLSPDHYLSPDPTLDHDVPNISEQSPKGHSSQKPSATDTNSASSQDHMSFDLAPLPTPTPPLDLTMESNPAASPTTTPSQDLFPPRAPYYVYLPHRAPPDHYTQPAGYGVRLWMAMGNSFSTQEESAPDPNRTFTLYTNISGVEGGDGDDVDTDYEGFTE